MKYDFVTSSQAIMLTWKFKNHWQMGDALLCVCSYLTGSQFVLKLFFNPLALKHASCFLLTVSIFLGPWTLSGMQFLFPDASRWPQYSLLLSQDTCLFACFTFSLLFPQHPVSGSLSGHIRPTFHFTVLIFSSLSNSMWWTLTMYLEPWEVLYSLLKVITTTLWNRHYYHDYFHD